MTDVTRGVGERELCTLRGEDGSVIRFWADDLTRVKDLPPEEPPKDTRVVLPCPVCGTKFWPQWTTETIDTGSARVTLDVGNFTAHLLICIVNRGQEHPS